ncbi:MAG: TetR/AcrR family transcriptional regulator [Pseudomonadota bacterium]
MVDTVERLLNAAENAVRARGFHAVSFRELADELGIKSASVHYYFRHKEDLGLALVERYAEKFFTQLEVNAANAGTPKEKVEAICQTYRDALISSDQMCLCGMLGAESNGLPAKLAQRVSRFFEGNVRWVSHALGDTLSEREADDKAHRIVATLQGAMMIATSLKRNAVFDQSISLIAAGVPDE